ncbi:ubiquitin-conjugating enzyme E2 Q2-like [Haliotis cracherodii]|uniref:ubiquitin-conjugating enzyme E2 Q2-like n=1 Tax=Haliotis cracherodii TaxID=6455 RepID=UPI0039E89222
MDLDALSKEVKDWKTASKTHLDLVDVDNTLRRLNFQVQNTDTRFYIDVTIDDNKTKWHVWSDSDSVLLKLQPSIEDVTSGKAMSLTDILTSCSKDLEQAKEDKDIEEEEVEGEDEDDDENDDYYIESEEFLDDIQATISTGHEEGSDVELEDGPGFFGPMNTATSTAIQRLKRDLKNILKVGPQYGIVAKPRGDNLFLWDVQLTDVPTDSRLGKDLQQYSTKYKQEPVVKLEMQFPQDYPFTPPFIRVISPRFKFLTGHVTIGGSICMEMLTKSGWVPANDIESILVQVRAEIMSDPNASLDSTRPNDSYTEREARDAFNRMVSRYGWNK